ncbi:PP2C family serine/threonine-protein phosphatase [Tessaracoccus lacteus]|uniref:PP2C family serine/threonine-protein phosphatase n=1 Tax=Tessaracoccus lacteus TaxID=3041766 RepID=A0ABY8PWB6_9ACTN|nr:PP2C family serine/threonine-protein phosphatase [Tessaracoccus sp. T21]WGT46677.1 PP2C family serine/threonine-protein phosphatase [Tessaracoccus sp. T21]
MLFKRYSTGIDIGALADGAGSARLSHYGAAVLVQEASHLIAHDFERIFRATNNLGTIRAEVVGQLQSKLAETARVGIDLTDSDRARLGYPSLDSDRLVRCDLRDLASTLLLVAVKGDRFVALHLGDGVVASEVALRSGRRVVRPLGGPDNGEFANETTFITSRSAAGMLRIYRGHLATSTRTISGFILMSDGPEVSLFQKRTRTLAPACSKLLEACRNLPSEVMQEQLEATLRDVIVPRTSDDCSLVLLAAPHPADADSAA